MTLTRRQLLGLGAGVLTLSIAGLRPQPLFASAADDAVKAFAGDAMVNEGGIELTAPEIAENGNTVPIGINGDALIKGDTYVKRVMILADGNPSPGVATFHFSPLSGSYTARTRVRLAKTQNVIAVAELSDGTFYKAQNQVKVTIGGCGG